MRQFARSHGLTNAERDQIAAGPAWTNNEIRYCFDPAIEVTAKQAINDAVAHYNQKFGSCLKYMEVQASGGNCQGYPETPAIWIQSSRGGCWANYMGEPPADWRRQTKHTINL